MTRLLFTGVVLIAGILPAPGASATADEPPRRDRYGDPLPKGVIVRLGTLRMRNCRGPVVFSPDGKNVVAVGGSNGTYYDSQAIFWDVHTGRRVKALTAKAFIRCLAFSPDGKQLAAVATEGNEGCPGSVWDVPTGKQRFTFTGQQVAFSADGKKLIAAHYVPFKNTIRSYSTSDGKQQTEWILDNTVEHFTLSPDGRYAATRKIDSDRRVDERIHVYDLQKKAEAKQSRFDIDTWEIYFSRDGRRLVAAGKDGCTVWDWESGKSRRLRNSPVVAFSPDGRRLAWIDVDNVFSEVCYLGVVEVDGGQPRSLDVTNALGGRDSAVFSDDGKKLAIVTEANAVVVLDGRTGRDLLPLDAHTGTVRSVAYFADNRYLVTCDSLRLLVWEAATGRLLRRFPGDQPVGETVLLNTVRRGRFLTVELPDGLLRLRDLATGKELRQLKGKHGFVCGVRGDVSEVSADGRLAAILGSEGVRVYDLASGEIRCRFHSERAIWDMRFSADNRTLAVTFLDDQKGSLTIHRDAHTGDKVETPAGQSSWKDVDGHWRETGAAARARLRKMNLLDAAGRRALAGRDEDIVHVCESPDGHYLAVRGGAPQLPQIPGVPNKSFLRLWDTTTRRLVLNLDDERGGAAEMVGFTSDGRMFLSQEYYPATISLWELATGCERLRLAGHEQGKVTVGFRPDGRVVVSGGADTQVLLWDVTGRMPDGIWRQTHHSPEQLAELWQTLAGEDAARAYRAMWSLEAAPEQTLTLLSERLRPMVAPEPGRLARLLAALDSDEFAEREKATRELEQLGELAKPALRRVLNERPTLEQRRRCEQLLEKLSVLSGERLRAVRAVEVVERLGTPEARKRLEEWRQGAPEARLTQEARAALNRLAVASKEHSEFPR